MSEIEGKKRKGVAGHGARDIFHNCIEEKKKGKGGGNGERTWLYLFYFIILRKGGRKRKGSGKHFS